jgi:hypothetical protein
MLALCLTMSQRVNTAPGITHPGYWEATRCKSWALAVVGTRAPSQRAVMTI